MLFHSPENPLFLLDFFFLVLSTSFRVMTLAVKFLGKLLNLFLQFFTLCKLFLKFCSCLVRKKGNFYSNKSDKLLEQSSNTKAWLVLQVVIHMKIREMVDYLPFYANYDLCVVQ